MSAGSVIDDALRFGKDIAKGEFKTGANEAINKLGNFTGVLEAAGRVISKNEGIGEALTRTFTRGAEDTLNEAGEKIIKHEGLNYGKIAGSYIGASAAYRILSGGGLYRDKNGNADIIGIPFV